MPKRARLSSGNLNLPSLGTTRIPSPRHKKARFPSHIIGVFARELCKKHREYDNRDDAMVERYLAASEKTAQLLIDRARPDHRVSEYTYEELTEILASESKIRSRFADLDMSESEARKQDALFCLHRLFMNTPELKTTLFTF